jgi:hypothetical protein
MPQALKLFGYGLLDVLGTGGPDSYGVSADALAALLAVHTDVQSTGWGKGKGAAASITISWLTRSIHQSAGGGAGLDRASRRTSFPDDGLPTSPGGGPPEPEEGQPAEEEPSSKARISAVLEGVVTTAAEYDHLYRWFNDSTRMPGPPSARTALLKEQRLRQTMTSSEFLNLLNLVAFLVYLGWF